MTEENNGLTPSPSLADALRTRTPPPPPPQPIVKNLWYNNKTLKIDGWSFESCRFDNCTLIVNSQFFTLKNCHLSETNYIQWGTSTINVIRLFNHQAGLDMPQPFCATQNPDGTVTIGG
jgi:hypothetical protein